MSIDKIIPDLEKAFSESLVSCYRYSEGFPLSSTLQSVNLLFVFKKSRDISLDQLKKTVDPFVKKSSATFKVFSVEEFESALDVFPVEFLEMRASGQLIFGTDYLAGLAIDNRHLRYELEFYLRSFLLKLREGVLLGHFSKTELIKQSFPRLLSLLKWILHLKNESLIQNPSQLIQDVQLHFKLELNEFKAILAKFEEKDLSVHFDAYLVTLESVITHVNDALN